MKDRFVPLEKRSKREQRSYHQEHRRTWGAINPVTRKPPNPKVYNRKKNRHIEKNDSMSVFCFLLTVIPTLDSCS